MGFSLNLSNIDCLSAELWGILKGLEIMWERGWRRVMVESDSRMTVAIIKGQKEASHTQLPFIMEIHDFLRKEWEIKVAHVCREANSVADRLASKAASSTVGLQTWDYLVPDFVAEVVRVDKDGCGFSGSCSGA